MDLKVIQENINIKGISSEINSLLEKYSLHDQNQISLQSYKENADPKREWHKGNGKVWDIPAKEEEFQHLLFDEIPLINHYIRKFKLYRTRIMKLQPGRVMSIHRDYSPRVHIPITTNDGCRMMIGKECYHLEVGNVYWTNTTIEHTAFNGGTDPRIHILGCVIKT